MQKKQGFGLAHGKFGELLQGALPGKPEKFFVTLPITQVSMAHFQYWDNPNMTKQIEPTYKFKSFVLVEKIMHHFGYTGGWHVKIESLLEEGKGLGSSTTDLIACARAILQAFEKTISIEGLLSFFKEIEPTDALMYDDIVCFHHGESILRKHLGDVPDIVIFGIDEGGEVDTIRFNETLLPYSPEEKIIYAQLLEKMIIAFQQKNLKKIAEISTKSALLHQKKYPKKNLSLLLNIAKENDALGIITTHSGTYLGIMLDPNHPNYFQQCSIIEKKLSEHHLVMKKFYTKTTRALEKNTHVLPLF
jgi:L-threonine kinase